MRLGAGLLIAVAAGAAAAGWWLPAGVALAGILAWCAARPAPVPERAEPLVGGARYAVRLAVVPVYASVFGAYLVPGHRAFAAVAFVLVVTVASTFGVALPRFLRAWVLGILLVVGAGLIALCLAISPERGTGGGPGATGMFAAGAALFPLLYRREAKVNWWLAGSVGAALVVCGVALYQLGPVRLGLSGVPLRDLLAAVDGQPIEPLLAGVAVIATVSAALGAFRETRGDLPPVAGGLAAAVGAALLDPVRALLLAAAIALAEVLISSLLTLSMRRRDVRAVLGAAFAITLLAWLPPLYLLLAVAVIAVAVVARRSTGTRAGSAPRPRPPE
ncbi:hypothetical protein HFP15_26915 [Amycolatopsis sp. K13G38]|uniref:Uncharacterized protein n=1 Tax=Amycolatopsis acididurans TaxID=2724524 RepID=A0ABX1JCC0_9PSEU|nr:hypothetical protein [Amycolatopsis acididurans]NKQ56514.1 hypothetical protein [Amycolatopsis acididurans]